MDVDQLLAPGPEEEIFDDEELDADVLLDLPEEEDNLEGDHFDNENDVLRTPEEDDLPNSKSNSYRKISGRSRPGFKPRRPTPMGRNARIQQICGTAEPGNMFIQPESQIIPQPSPANIISLRNTKSRQMPLTSLPDSRQKFRAQLPLSKEKRQGPQFKPALTKMPVDLNANPSGELNDYTPLKGVDVIVIDDDDDEEEVSQEENKKGVFDQYGYDDIEEDEITFLGSKPLDLNDYSSVKSEQFELIDIASDDEEFLGDDDDDDCVVVEEVKQESVNAEPADEEEVFEKNVPTDTTAVSISERIKNFKEAKFTELNEKAPILDPNIFRGKGDMLRLRKALRALTPQEANVLLARGRTAVLFKFIPTKWTNRIVSGMCSAYGRIKKVGVNHEKRWAKIVFLHEKSAADCEENLYNEVRNDENRKMVVKRVFDMPARALLGH